MNFLSILEYLKTLEGFDNHHPVICVGSNEIFEEYYDYYIIDGIVYVLGITSTSVGSGGYKTLNMINPDAITNVYIDDALGADLNNVTVSPAKGNSTFVDKAKTFINGCIKNANNFNLPYSKARFFVGDESIRVLENGFVVNGDLVSFDVQELSIGTMTGPAGLGKPMCDKFRIFTDFNRFQDISIPFADLKYSPMKDFVSNELLELSQNYRETHFGKWGKGVANYEHREYAKGDRVWLDVEIVSKSGDVSKNVPEKRMWFVSKANRNNDIPLSKEAKANDSWAEFDPETNALVVSE